MSDTEIREPIQKRSIETKDKIIEAGFDLICNDGYYKTIDKFIEWICTKFNFGDSKELVKKFEDETYTFIDPVKQIKKEEREIELSFDK